MVIPQEIRKRRAKYIQSNLKEGTNKEQKFMTLKRGKQYRKLMKNIIKIDNLLARLR